MLCERLQRRSSDSWCTNFKNSHDHPSERAMWYIGFYCINVSLIQCLIVTVRVEKLYFLTTPLTLECSFKFLCSAHAGFIMAQLKTLSNRRGSQGKQQYTNKRRTMSSLGTVMYFLRKSCFWQKLLFNRKFRKAFSAFIPRSQQQQARVRKC